MYQVIIYAPTFKKIWTMDAANSEFADLICETTNRLAHQKSESIMLVGLTYEDFAQ